MDAHPAHCRHHVALTPTWQGGGKYLHRFTKEWLLTVGRISVILLRVASGASVTGRDRAVRAASQETTTHAARERLDGRLPRLATTIRRNALRMTHRGRSGHVGSMLSMAELIAVLYTRVLNVDPETSQAGSRPVHPEQRPRRRRGLRRAGGTGVLSARVADGYYRDDGKLMGHISHHVPGVEFSDRLARARACPWPCGMALAAKRAGLAISLLLPDERRRLRRGRDLGGHLLGRPAPFRQPDGDRRLQPDPGPRLLARTFSTWNRWATRFGLVAGPIGRWTATTRNDRLGADNLALREGANPPGSRPAPSKARA